MLSLAQSTSRKAAVTLARRSYLALSRSCSPAFRSSFALCSSRCFLSPAKTSMFPDTDTLLLPTVSFSTKSYVVSSRTRPDERV